MAKRDRILVLLLWLSVIGLSTWVGGTLYNMLVIVPLWNASPPDSVRAFFHGTEWNRTIFNFFGPPFIVARNLPVFLALLVGWHRPPHRFYLLVAVGCLAAAAIYTFAYVYPVNRVLFDQAGGDHTAEEIRTMAARWVFMDRFRFAVGIVAFAAVLQAFRLPIARQRKEI